MEPALLCRRVAGILDGEFPLLALQHPPDAGAGGLPGRGTIAPGVLANVEVVLTHADIRAEQRVGRYKALPGLVHGDDHSVWINQRDMGRQRVQDGGLRVRGAASRPLAGTHLLVQLVERSLGVRRRFE